MTGVYQVYPKKRRSFFSGISINVLLILVNVVFYLIVMFFPQEFLLKNIAISLENVQELRIWTFLTSMFMHGGFIHLFVNMISLMFIGSLVEKILGPKRYLKFYLVSGLFAGLFYILIESLAPSGLAAVGASGALFGIVGLLVLLTPNLPVYLMFIPIPIKMKYAGPGMLGVLWLISAASGGAVKIGNTAHLGGLIAGLAYGIYLRKKYKNKTRMISKHFS